MYLIEQDCHCSNIADLYLRLNFSNDYFSSLICFHNFFEGNVCVLSRGLETLPIHYWYTHTFISLTNLLQRRTPPGLYKIVHEYE